MKTLFVDTNVFVRYIIKDDEEQHRKAVNLLRKARSRKVALVTGPPVFFEISWVLRSVYDYPRDRVLNFLKALSAMKGLTILDAELVAEALIIAQASGQGFPDAYVAASSQAAGADAVATFNRRHFEKMDVDLYAL